MAIPRGTRMLLRSLFLVPACSRPPPSTSLPADASDLRTVPARAPGALSVARAIDTLSVTLDPASLTPIQVTAHAGTFLGVESDVFVFAQGDARPILERRDVAPGPDFGVAETTWSTTRDGVPAPGTKYVVEMQLVLFETDVAPTKPWDPRAGKSATLWSRTLRQAEE